MNHKTDKNKLKIAMGAIALLSAMGANAGLVYEKDTASTASITYSAETNPLANIPDADVYLSQVGAHPSKVETVDGHARNLPLVNALKRVVPEGWRAYSKLSSIKDIKNVEFDGNDRPWPEVLVSVLRQGNLAAHIDWKTQEVTFKELPSVIIRR